MKFSELTVTTDYLTLDPLFFDKVAVTPLAEPYLISVNNKAAALLGVDEPLEDDPDLVKLLNGQTYLNGSDPFAMCYAGHQFGYFMPRLGDGRAINLGKVNGWNLQLKGAGQTLYSREGDGKAVHRSSIREYLISEAMWGLGIETTRALALIGSNEDVARESWEKAAMVLRLSPSWIRFGTFEYFALRSHQHLLKTLADYTIAESFPHLAEVEEPYLKMFAEIVSKTALLLAQWQSVGFNHGVMNTDNMSIAGLTIDYGPFAFMDDFQSHYICNHTDYDGRYSFSNQPPIAYWNLSMLARALTPLVAREKLDAELEPFEDLFEQHYETLMRAKAGLYETMEDDTELLRWLLNVLGYGSVDYTHFFRSLSRYEGKHEPLLELSAQPSSLKAWLEAYDKRLKQEVITTDERHQRMLKVNPKYVLKNYMLQEAIDKSQQGDHALVNELLALAHAPYDEHPQFEHYAKPTPREHKNQKLSCSS